MEDLGSTPESVKLGKAVVRQGIDGLELSCLVFFQKSAFQFGVLHVFDTVS